MHVTVNARSEQGLSVTWSSGHKAEDERGRRGEKSLFWKNKEGLVGLYSMPSKAGFDDKQRECVYECMCEQK